MSGGLSVDFEKRYRSGATIHAAFSSPANSRSTVLFGPSGSGKTTVLRCLAGLEQPARGVIRWNEEPWFDSDQRINLLPQSRGIGFLFQDLALFPHLTVAKNIAFGLRDLRRQERRTRVADMIHLLGLTGLEQRYPAQLSAGQQQRVALARSAARRPRLLLLDEPLSSLDTPARHALRGELRQLLTRLQIPAVVVTHDPIEAIALADHAVVMADGKVRQSGPVHEVFSRPTDPTVARIIGIETIVPATILHVHDRLATVLAGSAELTALTPDSPTASVYACIRGEDVTLERGTPTGTSARNRLAARVADIIAEGPNVRVTLDAGFALTALITRPAAADLALHPGDPITALIKAQAIHLIPRD